jgi:hypothetical protein
LLEDKRFQPALVRKLGLLGFQTIMWLSTMDEAYKLEKLKKWDATLRYEELLQHRGHMIHVLMEALYPQTGLANEVGPRPPAGVLVCLSPLL